MICGRCGGRIEFAGYMESVDYYECNTCGDVTAEFDPEYHHRIKASLHHNTRPSIMRLSAKAQFFTTGGVRKLIWQTKRK